MSSFSSAVSQRPSPPLPTTLLAFLGLKLPLEPTQKALSPPNPPDPPDPPPSHSFTDSLVVVVSPLHSPHLNFATVLAVNYLVSLSLLLTSVSYTEASLAFTRAFTAVCSSCSRFDLIFSCTGCQICSLFSWQPRLAQFPFPIILTLEGMISPTLLLVVQWSVICIRLAPSSISMRFHQYQLQSPQYEDVSLIMFNQSFARMAGMSPNGRHICRQSLEIIFSCFGVNLYELGYLSDCFDGDSDFPCIEGFLRLVLTFYVAKGLDPFISFGIYCVVDALWEDLCFTEEDVTSKSIRESRDWNEAFVPPPSSCQINSCFCGLGRFCLVSSTQRAISDARSWTEAQSSSTQQKPEADHSNPQSSLPAASACYVDAAWLVNGHCRTGWLFRNDVNVLLSQNVANHKFVGSAQIAETLAVKLALLDALSAGFHSVNISSDCKVLISLLKSGSSTVELRSLLHDIRDLSVSFTSICFNFIPRLENSVADVLAKAALLDVNSSSSVGG